MLSLTQCTCLQGIRRFVAKIGDANVASQHLFAALQYSEAGRSPVFREVSFELSLHAFPLANLSDMKNVTVGLYDLQSMELAS